MSFTLTGTSLDAPDATMLAGFYRRLLGWTVEVDEPGWVVLRPPGGGHATLAEFQPQEDVRVCLDPAGHPFCLYVEA
jgi:Glyoxalase-like domain